MFIGLAGYRPAEDYAALGGLICKGVSSLIDKVGGLFSHFIGSIEEKFIARSLSNRVDLFKIRPELAKKTARVLRENGVHSLNKKLGKGGFGAVCVISSDSPKPAALKLLAQPERYFDTRGESLALGLPKKQHLHRTHALLIYDPVTEEVSFHEASKASEIAGEVLILGTISRAYKSGNLLKKMKCGLSPDDVKKYGKNIADAIRNLHRQGILHRDIKPDNVLVAQNKRGKAHRVKLADFGLSTKDRYPHMAGTRQYVAPDSSFTESSDWFSFGKMLYEMATEPYGDRAVFPYEGHIADPQLRDLLFNREKGLLNGYPHQRYSGEEVINHPYFTGVPMPEHLRHPIPEAP